MERLYKKYTKRGKTKDGFFVVCKKGLWRVDAPTKEIAEREARHYFFQYFTDGEYKDDQTS